MATHETPLAMPIAIDDIDAGWLTAALAPVLPAGAEVSYPADCYTFIHQQVWLIDGRLRFREGDTTHAEDDVESSALHG